jgi:hypothetical protein
MHVLILGVHRAVTFVHGLAERLVPPLFFPISIVALDVLAAAESFLVGV